MSVFTGYSGGAGSLVDALLGPQAGLQIVPGSVVYSGASGAVSYYDGSIAQLGMAAGILLTTGDGTPQTSNTASNYGVSNGTAGDAQLTAAVQAAFSQAGATYDAASLSFSFTVTDPATRYISFNVVFGSDEYPEYSDAIVDIAGVFVNGVNVALFNADPSRPLSVLKKNEVDGGFAANQNVGIEYDGLSKVLTIVAPVVAGVNTIKIAIADTNDSILDSGIFIAGLRALNISGCDLSGIYKSVVDEDHGVNGAEARVGLDSIAARTFYELTAVGGSGGNGGQFG
ncbi:MAG: hypothetical protein E6G94_15565, partial [Alphaproteobacteria bacterium]